MNCPTCGQEVPEKSREDVYDDNCRLVALDEWIEKGCGTYEEWLRSQHDTA
jgi:endogenous inhibitor of DNA gyrase (YacG/DUF329 family)